MGYIYSIIVATLLFPIGAALLTMPYAIHQYRKYGFVPWVNTIALYTFVLYMMCAFALVVLPLPKDPSTLTPDGRTPRLVPFYFIYDIIVKCSAAVAKTGSITGIFKVVAFYGAVFNVFLTIPLGMYLRYFFRRNWWQTLIIGFCCTLFFELTQLTGDWGLYPYPYRLFDVDDLILNTTGCMLGFALVKPLMSHLPRVHVARYESYNRALRASATHRFFALMIDLILSWIVTAAILLAAFFTDVFEIMRDASLLSNGPEDSAVVLALLFLVQLAVFCGIPAVTGGQTIGLRVLKLRMVKPDGAVASRQQCFSRNLLMLAFAYSFEILILFCQALDITYTGVSGDEGVLFASLNDNAQTFEDAWYIFILFWLFTLFMRALLAKRANTSFVMLTGIISNTRIMTNDAIAIANEHRKVMDVADVVALEKRLDAEGTSLASLMDKAGHALAVTVAECFYTKLEGAKYTARNAAHPVLVLAGNGNNGGDGWVAARYLSAAGFPVTILSTKAAEELTAEPARSAALETMASNLPINVVLNPSEEQAESAITEAKTVIDCLLGTGFHGAEVREPYATWINIANKHSDNTLFSLAADVPSGLSAQDGTAATPCFKADLTVTMLALKPALAMEECAQYTGTVRLAPLVDSRN